MSEMTYSKERKQETKAELDATLIAAIKKCADAVEDNIKDNKDIKSVKEIASTIEVLMRTAYTIMEIQKPKDDDGDDTAFDLLVSMLDKHLKGGDGTTV